VGEASTLVPGRALDVGAGEGGDAIWLAQRGWQVTAADISSRALARLEAEADRLGLDIECLRRDANDPGAYGLGAYDLVSMQYGSVHRTPEGRGLHHLLDAVAPGGTLLVVGHDLSPMREPVDVAQETRMYDPDAYLGVEEIANALAERPEWRIELHETRPRPPGAVTTHHVDDVVLRARRSNG
jgi:SAM-dependent methyltransferase